MKLIIAEKPSVARDIAKVLGLKNKKDGYIHGTRNGVDICVSWCIGHLVGLSDPGETNPAWMKWNLNQLPMIPKDWKLKTLPRTKKQFSVLKKLLKDKSLKEVICATDAGREGELIFRLLYLHAKCKAEVKRLWISSLTDEAIADGFRNLKPAKEYDNLFESAFSRAKADWLVGMNFSRFYSIKLGSNFSVGRVQTPTLKLIVDRELEITRFKVQKFLSIKGKFYKAGSSEKETYIGELNLDLDKLPSELVGHQKSFNLLFDEEGKNSKRRKSSRIPLNEDIYNYFKNRMEKGDISIGRVSKRSKEERAPLLHDLTDLQREANKVYGFSASDTLKYAQNLYEKYKLITYPRTDSRYLTNDLKPKIKKIWSAVSGNYQSVISGAFPASGIPSRYVNNSKVGDHHAILPTGSLKGIGGASQAEKKVFDLICRRFLMAFEQSFLSEITNVSTLVSFESKVDRYLSRGTIIKRRGWKALLLSSKSSQNSEDAILPEWLEESLEGLKGEPFYEEKVTKPPKRYTDASLLTAMESAGKFVDEKDLGDVIKESGIGTPATRAGIVETLIKREYVGRKGKSFIAFDKGIRLIEQVFPKLSSVSLTAEWEKALDEVNSGELYSQDFDLKISNFVKELLSNGERPHNSNVEVNNAAAKPINGRVDGASKKRQEETFNVNLKPAQSAAVKHLSQGKDTFCMLPTGYGKSMIYQYAGLNLGGRTLVVSPLIALMKDQVDSIRQLGIDARLLSSEKDFESYLSDIEAFIEGDCKFLFVSPEKASNIKFIEKVTRAQISLLVFDEAHCISTWGSDFRPHYKKLSGLVKAARPAPVCLLSATVTPSIYKDVLESLGISNAENVVSLEIPENNKIHVSMAEEPERLSEIAQILESDTNKPSVVYVPTRKLAEQLSEKISSLGVTAHFHAGLRPQDKTIIQSAFLNGQIDIVVATIAFGMGINKPDIRSIIHYAAPMSLENYVQEIGRGGRDGKASKSFLFYCETDEAKLYKRLELSYPKIEKIEEYIKEKRFEKFESESYLDRAIRSKLFGLGILLYSNGSFELNSSIDESWKKAYSYQKSDKLNSLGTIIDFITDNTCRKSVLNNHFRFSDVEKNSLCGNCDNCDGLTVNNTSDNSLGKASNTKVLKSNAPDYLAMLEGYIKDNSDTPSTIVYQRFAKPIGIEREKFWSLITTLQKAKKIKVRQETKKVRGRNVVKKILSYEQKH